MKILDPRFLRTMIAFGVLLLGFDLGMAWGNWRRGDVASWFFVGMAAIVATTLAFEFNLYYFPAGTLLRPDAKGIIHHPWYGDYPAVVPFQQGMTLMAGQQAMGAFELRMEPASPSEGARNGAS